MGVASLSTCSAEAAPSGQPARARGRRKTPPLSAVHPKKKGGAIRQRVYSKASPPVSLYGGGGKRPLPQHTQRKKETQNDRECTRRLRPGGIRKSKICSAEVVRFASNPPRQRGEGALIDRGRTRRLRPRARARGGENSNPPTRKLSVWSQVYRLARLRSSASHPTRPCPPFREFR